MMNPLFMLINTLCGLVFWVVIITVTLSWLVAFNVVNTRHPFMGRVYDALTSLTEKIYAPIRKFIPTIYGGMDISPVIVLIGLQLVQYTLQWLTVRYGI
jgi:YggT family protein